MQTYELTQKILSIGATYEVRNAALPDASNCDPLLTIKGKLFSMSPSLSISQGGADGPVIGAMKGNFARTKFECKGADDVVLGSLAFPMIALKKSFTLHANDKEYKADGGYLAGELVCKDPAGEVVLKITKQLALRDKFRIEADESIPAPLALLAAVAIDQRFFQEQ
jgi:uncharacterized protein YxjI